jgi:hypothetical protein
LFCVCGFWTPVLMIRNSGSEDPDAGYEASFSVIDAPVSGSEDPNPVSRLCIPVLSMRILDSCSMDPEFLVLRIWMPILSPGFRFQ